MDGLSLGFVFHRGFTPIKTKGVKMDMTKEVSLTESVGKFDPNVTEWGGVPPPKDRSKTV